MRKPASGTPAHIPAIPADKIAASINFLESLHREAVADAERNREFLEAKCFHTGRAQSLELALFEIKSLREVAK